MAWPGSITESTWTGLSLAGWWSSLLRLPWWRWCGRRTTQWRRVRATMGETSPAAAGPGTIRGDLGLDIGRNLVHGSDSVESARREVALFFSPDEILDYSRSVDAWVKEP